MALLFPLVSAYSTIDQRLDNICCILKSDRSIASRGLLQRVYPNMDSLPLVGASFLAPDPERVMSLRPDAVFVFHTLAEPLEKVGMPNLIHITFNPFQRDRDGANIWNLVGDVSKKSLRANAVFKTFLDNMKAFQTTITSMHLSPVRVLPFLITGIGTWTIAGMGFQLNSDIQLVGGMNPAQPFFFKGNVDTEELLVLDPEVIILLPWGAQPSNPGILYNDPKLQSIRAVKNRRVYLMPVISFFNQPVDEPLILSWMSQVFHPAVMIANTRQLYRDIYRDILHYELSEDEIDQALFLKENSRSADYYHFIRSNIESRGHEK